MRVLQSRWDEWRILCRARCKAAAGLLGVLFGLAVLYPATAMAEPATGVSRPHVALAARMVGDDNRVRLVLDFETRPDIQVRYLANPNRAVIELPETLFAFDREALAPRGLVSSVRYGKSGPDRSRMVLELAAPARLDAVEPEDEAVGAVHRLVFDAVSVSPAAFAGQVAQTDWSNPEPVVTPTRAKPDDTLTIVIDPGHGGIDGGAEGPAGSMEKHVTLAFAEAFKAALEAEDGIRVVMTRTDDSFLSLSARVRLAREASADLFVSLHADSISLRSLRGATVYTLSDRASDSLAQTVADQENREEAGAGASLADAPEAISAILSDLARTETRVFSTGLAQQVIASFEGQVKLINNPHRHAGFRVLQAPDVPSVLVELGYLSNREDEKLLNEEAWRHKTAGLLAMSVQKFRQTILAGRK